ncbi:hypothetical protein BC834DRAFT_613255 [Gloeopeniophorella convolvens]|nr:hypothetical protein BC834DRAFT_613255 [Gloeopeniophorella convolvens]
MAFAIRSSSPPPRMPSPQLLPTPLPSPPPLRRQQSRQRLNASSQAKPPSPTTKPTTPTVPSSHAKLHSPKACSHPPLNINLWLDGDDFGTRREQIFALPTPCPTTRESLAERAKSQRPLACLALPAHPRSRTRSRSPPPSPGRPGTPPPVPPIPTQFLGEVPAKPALRPQSASHLIPVGDFLNLPPPDSCASSLRKAKSIEAVTYMRFVAVHSGR